MLNKAVVQSRAEYLIFLDGDCIPHRKFVEEHCKARREGFVVAGRRVDLPAVLSEGMSVGKVASPGRAEIGVAVALCRHRARRETYGELYPDYLPRTLRRWFIRQRYEGILGCNFSMYKSDLLKANGFDERYVNPGTGEDTDLEDRLVRLGTARSS